MISRINRVAPRSKIQGRLTRPTQILVLAAMVVLLVSNTIAAVQRPNVLVILSDDQGWGDLSLNGNTNLSTPNIDSLARDGAQFERFFVCPVCSPTRAEFLTGRYHPRSGVFATSAGGERMNLDEVTIADTFKAGGYTTAAFGKWHNGQQYPYHPNGRGFDEFFGFCSGHWADYFDAPLLDHNGDIVNGRGYLEDDFTDNALAFIKENKNRPFFAYVAFNSPHSPMQVPDKYWNRFKDKELKLRGKGAAKENVEHTRAALAMCENLDWNVGRVLQQLDKLGIADNTIVLYFCDNGPNGARWNGGMRGVKASTDEGGIRSPLVIRWPGHIPAGTTVSPISGAIDLLPTLAALCDIPLISTKPLDGRTLKPLLLKPSNTTTASVSNAALSDRMIFSYWAGKTSVRTQQHRLDHRGRLYDMVADPGQKTDVAKQHPKIQARLSAAVKKWSDEVVGNLGHDDRPLPIGHPDSKNTQLAAADGVSHGGIKRLSPHPNSSFFTNWKRPDDSITWDGEVLASGDYAVELYYTCQQSDVGSTVELSFNGNRVMGEVTESNDSPLRGAEHDRVPRGESYTKDFLPMKLGTIHLKKGRGELTLRATKIPGSQVMDFRLLVLTRVKK
jgi:arylsulfatase A-like enzyme